MIKLQTIAEQHEFSQQRLTYQLRRTGVPIVKAADRVLLIHEKDLLRVQMLIARCKLTDTMPRTKRQLANAQYHERVKESEMRVKLGMPPIEFKRGRPQIHPQPPQEVNLNVVFEWNGIVKRGEVIGGIDKHGAKKATVKFTHDKLSKIADIPYENVLHKTFEEIEQIVIASKRKRSKWSD
jgi:hypothetical protein